MSLQLHSASAASVPLLAELHGACFTPPWDRAAIARMLAMPGAFALLAIQPSGAPGAPHRDEEGEPVGFLIARTAAGEAEILTIGTRSEFRGQGVARALMRKAIEMAREAGAESLFLEVATDNDAAIRLYEGLGFASVGLRPNYYERPGGAVAAKTMKLTLISAGPS